VLLARVADSADDLPGTLEAAGISCFTIPLYRTVFEIAGADDVRGGVVPVALETLFEGLDWAAFTSASTVDGFAAMARTLPDGLWRLSGIKALCIGEQTRKAAERHGFVCLTARQATLESMVEALKNKVRDADGKTFRHLAEAIQNPLALDGNAYAGKYELNAKSTRHFIQNFFKNKEYPLKLTGENIYFGTRGTGKIAGKSGIAGKIIASVPDIIENSIIISSEIQPYKQKSTFPVYKYGINIIEIDRKQYAVKTVFGKNERNKWEFYDFSLSEIKKGSESVSKLKAPVELMTSGIQDSTLLKILQVLFQQQGGK
jgi:hypothetical protein